MEYPIRDDAYEKAKEKAWENYDKIGRVWSPILNDHVLFNKVGFWHLIRKGNKHRPRIHQIKRFALIPCAGEIISRASTQISKREGTKNGRYVHFWAFRATVDGKSIRVVVQQIGNGHKHFLSVFEEEK